MDIENLYKIFLQHPDITTDSRNIRPGQIFFALKGPTFNGNEFVQKALALGASYAVTDEGLESSDKRILRTKDVLETLQQLAKFHRKQLNIPFIAITGSNGKTTTKELVTQVLSSTYRTQSTRGNLNNHIGVPLTILGIRSDTEMAVIEMGANHQKEIESYCEYTLPSHGLITNCGKAHLEGFGGVGGVIKGKGELFKYLEQNNGVAFVNNYDEAIKNLSKNIEHQFTYGPNGAVDGTAKSINSLLAVSITGSELLEIRTNLIGDYNLPNILAAVAIGRYFKVADFKIKEAIENYIPSNSRSQLMKINGNEIIMDAYNANPSSMKAAIENFAKLPGEKKILMLGSMMELGSECKKEHEDVLKLIDKYQWEKVVLVGDYFNDLEHPYIKMGSSDEAGRWFKTLAIKGASLLIKGSRSIRMENVLNEI